MTHAECATTTGDKKISIDILGLLIQLYADQEGVEIKIKMEERTYG